MADSLTDPSNWRKALDAREDWLLHEIARIVERALDKTGSRPTPAQIRAQLEPRD